MTTYKRMLQQSRDGATRRPGNTKTTKDLDMLRDTQHPDIVMACDMLQALSEEKRPRMPSGHAKKSFTTSLL